MPESWAPRAIDATQADYLARKYAEANRGARDPMCEHETKGRKLASTVAALASEREAARLAKNSRLADELEHSRKMTLLAMRWNRQDHEKECEQ